MNCIKKSISTLPLVLMLKEFNKTTSLKVVLFIAILVFNNTFSQNLDDYVEWSIEFATQQMKNTIEEMNNDSTKHPNQTGITDGSWVFSTRDSWISGFFSGAAWYLYELNFEDSYWKNIATRWTLDLEPLKYSTGSHDVGFQIFCSFGNAYRLTGNEEYKNIIITAANSLSTRYDSTIGCIRSWSWGSWNFPVIIDNMMNLEILMWAAENGGDERLKEIAVSHAKKTIENHIRVDGSTYHVVDYNNDGTVKAKDTHQGYNVESTWSRGQAWGLYGFTMMYRYTKNDTFLTTAKHLADYFVDNLPNDFVPYSDFEDPNIPNVSKDASAAAIACSALFELGKFTDESKYKNSAYDILNSLMNNYIAKNSIYHSVIKKACIRSGDGERGLIYADYYFLEALKRYKLSVTGVEKDSEKDKMGFELFQNYPNPFNPSTTIGFSLGSNKDVSLVIYNIEGKVIKSLFRGTKSAGNHYLVWNTDNNVGEEVSSGIYFYSLTTDSKIISKKMILLR